MPSPLDDHPPGRNKRAMRARKSRETKETKKERGGILRLVVTVAIVAWVIRSLIFSPFSIPSGSMLPTLLIGDYLVAAKWPYGYSRFSFPLQIPPIQGRIPEALPDRGDVVVFRPPGQEGTDFVKRVIALPGDTVELRGGTLLLNGQPIRKERVQPFAMAISFNSPCRAAPGGAAPVVRSPEGDTCLYPAFRETLPGGRSYTVLDQIAGPADDFPAVSVPAGHLFLMGDNRDDSMDSRFGTAEGGIGFVPLENIVGRATMIFWSTDGSASYVKPWTWFSALRASRIGTTFGDGE